VTTTNKDFRVKNGLIVEGNSATVNGNQVITSADSIDSLQNVNTSGVQNTNVLSYLNGVWIPVSDVGLQGIQGTQGLQGVQGIQGTTGVQGTQGIQGPIGEEGIVAQTEPPANTEILWLDTDESAADNSIPAGGTSGQVLSKIDATDYNTQWINQSGGGGSPVNGIKTQSGNYIRTETFNVNTSTADVDVDVTYLTPIFIPVTQTYSRIAIRTGITFSGSTIVRLGLYNHDVSTGQPTTVLLDAGTVNAVSINTVYEITISQSLSAGIYWLASNCISATANNRFTTLNVPTLTQGTLINQFSSFPIIAPIFSFRNNSDVINGFLDIDSPLVPWAEAPLVALRAL
jgi:hypothetical protein